MRSAAGSSPPRTAYLLHTALTLLADQAYDDALRLGDQFLPDTDSTGWQVFGRLPRSPGRPPMAATHGTRLRRPGEDLAQGGWPEPTCSAEEMALHLAIENAPELPARPP